MDYLARRGGILHAVNSGLEGRNGHNLRAAQGIGELFLNAV